MADRIRTKIKEVTLRFATEDDVSLIFQFIKDLAEYEKLTHEVVANEQILHQSLFSERQVAEVIIAEYNTEPVGFALFFHNFSTFVGKPGIYIEDIFVKPHMRGKGIGKVLLTFITKLAHERNCGRIEWAVLNWNEPAINFYKKLGAKPMDEWTIYRISGKTITEISDEF